MNYISGPKVDSPALAHAVAETYATAVILGYANIMMVATRSNLASGSVVAEAIREGDFTWSRDTQIWLKLPMSGLILLQY